MSGGYALLVHGISKVETAFAPPEVLFAVFIEVAHKRGGEAVYVNRLAARRNQRGREGRTPASTFTNSRRGVARP